MTTSTSATTTTAAAAATAQLAAGPCFPPHPSPSTIGPLYIAHFATTHATFRLPDFYSAAAYLEVPFAFVPVPVSKNYPSAASSSASMSDKHAQSSTSTSTSAWQPDPTRPYQLVYLPSDAVAQQLLRRCVSLRSIWAYWAHGSSYAELHALAQTPSHRPLWEPSITVPSWKAHVFSYSGTISERRKVDVIQSFAYMEFQGRIQLREPSMRWGVMEEYLGQDLWPAGYQPTAAPSRAERLQQEGRASAGASADADTSPSSAAAGAAAATGKAAPAAKHEPVSHLMQDPTATGDGDPRLVQIFAGRRIDLRVESLVPSLSRMGIASGSGAAAEPPRYRKSNDPALEGQTGLARDLIDKLDLKKRVYIGNTSMESEMSLLMASLALAGPGRMVYDPFAGTGSLLYAAAVFGAMTLGSDIDGRTMRGKTNAKLKESDPARAGSIGIIKSAQQYGVRDRILDCLVCDMSRAPFRRSLFEGKPASSSSSSSSSSSAGVAVQGEGGFLDGIVADPPYGVRAGAKRLGKRDPEKQRDEAFWMPDGLGPGKGCWSHERSDYIPPTRPYHLVDLIDDLLEYAYNLLKPHGRLVFWLPVVIDADDGQDDDDGGEGEGEGEGEGGGGQQRERCGSGGGEKVKVDLPRHKRARGQGRMRLLHHSLQDFGRWGRRLITMEKVPPSEDVDGHEGDLEGNGDGEREGGGEAGVGRTAVRAPRTDGRGVYRADADPDEFRNRYFVPRSERAAQQQQQQQQR
ncbi:related to TRM11 - Catalytic subunit of an adoMet-dependent tRNA [Pseudozyma flocculosa]|uniref:tRNA (guanine(10)-N(2))-methyltransferase n=1 Tax=Pseudozyma flocculosa TaxID=84751 RepID=A0A5C3F7G9_9BASI|nr:related to TRM11 - Catalytic subunit of an adoMet-dependent tRNA [Pseudozyma flocculosa]